MKCVTFDGLGEYAFYDVRFDPQGMPTQHPLNDPRYKGASLFLAGRNFGCGSSREHAPQSLHKFGVRAIIGLSFAEIFFGNCTTLGIPCVTVTPDVHETLTQLVTKDPSLPLVIDVANEVITAGTDQYPCQMPHSAHEALTTGIWDPIALLLDEPQAVRQTASRLGYVA
jgi:3-isopropylmalate/(R)-2-methylmalate dehydratase small subunit